MKIHRLSGWTIFKAGGQLTLISAGPFIFRILLRLQGFSGRRGLHTGKSRSNFSHSLLSIESGTPSTRGEVYFLRLYFPDRLGFPQRPGWMVCRDDGRIDSLVSKNFPCFDSPPRVVVVASESEAHRDRLPTTGLF
jgi:hypothetical protein